MKQACVIGWPVEHSRSPLIHGYWLEKYGVDGAYTKVPVTPEELRTFLSGFAERGFIGCNVTVPHKEAALAAADVPDAAARVIGAANTLWLEAGRLHATNTDAYGFITHLAQSAPDWQRQDRRVAVLGAGGAARAIVHALLEQGVTAIHVFNRSPGRAGALARHFGPTVRARQWQDRSRLEGMGVLVNTTTLGMQGAPALDVELAALPSDAVVYDVVYVPLETPLLAAARLRGLIAVDGLGMLLHQAVPGFEKWFGVRPEVTPELRDLLIAALARS